jgi:hypothetical protein
MSRAAVVVMPRGDLEAISKGVMVLNRNLERPAPSIQLTLSRRVSTLRRVHSALRIVYSKSEVVVFGKHIVFRYL